MLWEGVISAQQQAVCVKGPEALMNTTIDDRRLRNRSDEVLQALILSLKLLRDLPTLNQQF